MFFNLIFIWLEDKGYKFILEMLNINFWRLFLSIPEIDFESCYINYVLPEINIKSFDNYI